jgi:hypothetical protein
MLTGKMKKKSLRHRAAQESERGVERLLFLFGMRKH